MTEAGRASAHFGGTLSLCFEMMDAARRAQAMGLRMLGFGPQEAHYDVIASGRRWRLRRYAGPSEGPVVLIVAAPIKHPYIWDLSPSTSAVRACLESGLQVFLLEWKPPVEGDGGLAAYADEALAEAADATLKAADSPKVFLMGHSLGGALAAISAALHPEDLSGIVLLSAPLSFAPGVSAFRDALVAMAPGWLPDVGIMPGSLLSQLSAVASPQSFVWSRLSDAVASADDPHASNVRLQIEQWALDEVSLSGPLIHDIFCRLYRENLFCRGELEIGGARASPFVFDLPTFAVSNARDDIAPAAAMTPFLDTMAGADKRFIEYPGETGVVLQHLGILIGRKALASIWPEIVGWVKSHYVTQ
jgi:polyhydroxyalkanoate synthase